MNSDLYASLVVNDFNIPRVCKNTSMNVHPHDYDAMLHKSLGVVDIPNIKLLKTMANKFHKNLNKLFCENDDSIAKLNESNKLVEKNNKLTENSLQKVKQSECLNIDFDTKLVLSTKLVNNLKYENESHKMHAKRLIGKPIAKNAENICFNHIMVPDCIPTVCSISKDKSVYISPHKRNQKLEIKALKPRDV